MTTLRQLKSLRAFRVSLLLLAVATLSAQVPEHRVRIGMPIDWSTNQLVFNRKAVHDNPNLARMEPRILYQMIREHEPPVAHVPLEGPSSLPDSERDWSVSLGTGHVAFGQSPAKYGFDVTAPPSCSGDYAVYGLNVAGTTGGQANMVAYNNLYSGPGGICGSGGPSVLFAYNVSTAGGRILTSPTLSLDGTQIAFVESATGASILHILTWKTGPGNGTSATNSAAPGVGNTASLVSITYSTTATDTRSSVWVDYLDDAGYVGADDGKVYKIQPFFKGPPTLLGSPWPVTVAAFRRLTAPAFDVNTQSVYVGDGQGVLYQVNATNATITKSINIGTPGQRNPALVQGPLFDITNGTLFAISSNDGTSAVLVQVNASTMTQMTRARIGEGSTAGTVVNLYNGAFNNNYFTKPASGYILVCGTGAADTTPRRYLFGFTGIKMNTSPSNSTQILPSTRSRCGPITEFFNPNIGATGTDFFFWGMNADCTGTNTLGCIMSRANDVITAVNETAGTSGVIIDNDSTMGQASSIYFSNQGSGPSAVKLTQNGLQ